MMSLDAIFQGANGQIGLVHETLSQGSNHWPYSLSLLWKGAVDAWALRGAASLGESDECFKSYEIH